MRLAIVNETSAADRNKEIYAALDGRGHTIINAGMVKSGAQPELQYIHTGFISALLLNLNRVDLVVGGCGTGIGYMNSVMQYPGVICGIIHSPLDAWLYAQINDGNCISLALHQGYGWASDVNLRFIFDKYFDVEHGCGYPAHRKEPQGISRQNLQKISTAAHHSMAKIIPKLPVDIVKSALEFPGMKELVDIPHLEESAMKKVLSNFY